MTNSVVRVELGQRSYQILVQPGWLTQGEGVDLVLESLQPATFLDDRAIMIVTDTNVAALYLQRVVQFFESVAGRVDTQVIASGESSKDVNHLRQLWDSMADKSHSRHSVLVALGGGVVGDLAGFAAASFMRGIPWIQIPTSLMAQVDSSVGGKTGINLSSGKNLIGAFWQPSAVWIDPCVLASLDDRQFAAGLAEVVKYAIIMDPQFLDWLERERESIMNRRPVTLQHLIRSCCQFKAQIVGDDERELTGQRAILNYGHTFGHAIENVVGYGEILHGEAISMGMNLAMQTACQLKRVEQTAVDRQQQLLSSFGLPTRFSQLAKPPKNRDQFCQQILAAMHKDKKSDGKQVSLILPSRLGQVESVAWPGDDLVGRVLKGTF